MLWGRVHEADAEDAPLGIEPDIVIDAELMPFAGQDHVVVAVEPQFHRPLRASREQCRGAGDE